MREGPVVGSVREIARAFALLLSPSFRRWAGIALLVLYSGGAALVPPALAGTKSVSFLTGLPANARSTLHVEQSGSPDIEVNARFRSDALTAPIYWALRLSTESPVSVWSLELHHHKIFLEDPPAPVERFSISHGLNFLTLQRTWRRRPVDWRAGAGVIVAHPENTVRGLRLDESRGLFSRGYYVTGPAVLAGIARRVRVTAPIAVEVEARVSAARVRVPVHDGHARFVHLGVHLMVGLFGLLP